MKKIKIYLFLIAIVLGLGTYCTCAYYFTRPDLTVFGFVDLADGLGRLSADLIHTFKNKKHISFISTANRDCYRDVPFRTQLITKYSRYRYNKLGKIVILEDQLWRYNDRKLAESIDLIKKQEDSINIAYSMFESTRIPSEWVRLLNLKFDAVCVPDIFLKEIYVNNGVTIPIFILPLGLEMDHFLERPLKQSCGYPMVFGNLSSCSDRKNQLTLVRAFIKAFGDNPDVQLRINSRFGNPEVISALENEILTLKVKNIQFTNRKLTQEEYLHLFETFDCYVNISKGEGFSIQPREAMVLGIPTIITDNTAQSTICKSGLAKVVSAPIEAAAYYLMGNGVVYYGNNYSCTVDEVAKALLDVYENYDRYLAQAPDARKWASKYSYKNLESSYISLISPKKVILGNQNKISPYFIMTDSAELYKKYQKLIAL